MRARLLSLLFAGLICPQFALGQCDVKLTGMYTFKDPSQREHVVRIEGSDRSNEIYYMSLVVRENNDWSYNGTIYASVATPGPSVIHLVKGKDRSCMARIYNVALKDQELYRLGALSDKTIHLDPVESLSSTVLNFQRIKPL